MLYLYIFPYYCLNILIHQQCLPGLLTSTKQHRIQVFSREMSLVYPKAKLTLSSITPGLQIPHEAQMEGRTANFTVWKGYSRFLFSSACDCDFLGLSSYTYLSFLLSLFALIFSWPPKLPVLERKKALLLPLCIFYQNPTVYIFQWTEIFNINLLLGLKFLAFYINC